MASSPCSSIGRFIRGSILLSRVCVRHCHTPTPNPTCIFCVVESVLFCVDDFDFPFRAAMWQWAFWLFHYRCVVPVCFPCCWLAAVSCKERDARFWLSSDLGVSCAHEGTAGTDQSVVIWKWKAPSGGWAPNHRTHLTNSFWAPQ